MAEPITQRDPEKATDVLPSTEAVPQPSTPTPRTRGGQTRGKGAAPRGRKEWIDRTPDEAISYLNRIQTAVESAMKVMRAADPNTKVTPDMIEELVSGTMGEPIGIRSITAAMQRLRGIQPAHLNPKPPADEPTE